MDKQLRQTELRLRNDLHEYKYKKLTIGEFITEVSDIIKDEYNMSFKINVSITKKSNTKFSFIILFGKDYPFKPPKIVYDNKYTFPCVDSFGFLSLKFLQEDQWSPCLSLKVIIYALELLIYDPNDRDYNSIQLIDSENMARIDLRNESFTPKIITENMIYNYRNKSKKRKYYELEKLDYSYEVALPINRFKMLSIREIDQQSMSTDN